MFKFALKIIASFFLIILTGCATNSIHKDEIINAKQLQEAKLDIQEAHLASRDFYELSLEGVPKICTNVAPALPFTLMLNYPTSDYEASATAVWKAGGFDQNMRILDVFDPNLQAKIHSGERLMQFDGDNTSSTSGALGHLTNDGYGRNHIHALKVQIGSTHLVLSNEPPQCNIIFYATTSHSPGAMFIGGFTNYDLFGYPAVFMRKLDLTNEERKAVIAYQIAWLASGLAASSKHISTGISIVTFPLEFVTGPFGLSIENTVNNLTANSVFIAESYALDSKAFRFMSLAGINPASMLDVWKKCRMKTIDGQCGKGGLMGLRVSDGRKERWAKWVKNPQLVLSHS